VDPSSRYTFSFTSQVSVGLNAPLTKAQQQSHWHSASLILHPGRLLVSNHSTIPASPLSWGFSQIPLDVPARFEQSAGELGTSFLIPFTPSNDDTHRLAVALPGFCTHD
jgi:hypothetical protein